MAPAIAVGIVPSVATHLESICPHGAVKVSNQTGHVMFVAYINLVAESIRILSEMKSLLFFWFSLLSEPDGFSHFTVNFFGF